MMVFIERRITHPSEFIKEISILPLTIPLRTAAAKFDGSSSTFSRLVKGEADLSTVMALKLCKAFGRSPGSWMLMLAEY